MVYIDMKMPKRCNECPFLLKVPSLCICYCMATGYQIKYGEDDLKDYMCPLQESEERDD